MSVLFICIFFCKQNTAYEMRISDWSSDVCSSDLTDNWYRPVHPEQPEVIECFEEFYFRDPFVPFVILEIERLVDVLQKNVAVAQRCEKRHSAVQIITDLLAAPIIGKWRIGALGAPGNVPEPWIYASNRIQVPDLITSKECGIRSGEIGRANV